MEVNVTWNYFKIRRKILAVKMSSIYIMVGLANLLLFVHWKTNPRLFQDTSVPVPLEEFGFGMHCYLIKQLQLFIY